MPPYFKRNPTTASWGNYPSINTEPLFFNSANQAQQLVQQHRPVIARGNGRSYGDSALATHMLDGRGLDYFLSFDEEKGILHAQTGVLLSDILQVVVPKGWFLAVTPGTKLITLGGAIASDVHGKNHHIAGCFSEYVQHIRLLLADGSIQDVYPGEPLFHATCGGMGLTGVIIEATLSLQKITSSLINQTTIKTAHLRDTFAAFEAHQNQPYSVAWIDCLAAAPQRGKSVLMVGSFANNGPLQYQHHLAHKTVPFMLPRCSLNTWSVKAFNWLYYRRAPTGISQQQVDIDSFFYPLDAIRHWNRLYGKHGFVQYQFILPKATSYDGLQAVLSAIAASGKGSFLAVLKLHGPANQNWLSFPLEGYSLALDFKVEARLFPLLDRLDDLVVHYGGRIYLAKDARVPRAIFEKGYPHIEQFRQFRQQHGMDKQFHSLQSQRLGL